MPTSSPLQPLLLKGALVAFRLPSPRPSVIIFQFNPESVTRTLEARRLAEDANSPDNNRITGAPVETIKMDVVLDATDFLEADDPVARSAGIHPELAALELLLYPETTRVISNTLLLAAGTIEIAPPDGPFLILVYGPNRVLPVRLMEYSVTEEAHDQSLNPIRAKVSLGLRVLSYNDLPVTHPGYALFLANQIAKEVAVKASLARTVASVADKVLSSL